MVKQQENPILQSHLDSVVFLDLYGHVIWVWLYPGLLFSFDFFHISD